MQWKTKWNACIPLLTSTEMRVNAYSTDVTIHNFRIQRLVVGFSNIYPTDASSSSNQTGVFDMWFAQPSKVIDRVGLCLASQRIKLQSYSKTYFLKNRGNKGK